MEDDVERGRKGQLENPVRGAFGEYQFPGV